MSTARSKVWVARLALAAGSLAGCTDSGEPTLISDASAATNAGAEAGATAADRGLDGPSVTPPAAGGRDAATSEAVGNEAGRPVPEDASTATATRDSGVDTNRDASVSERDARSEPEPGGDAGSDASRPTCTEAAGADVVWLQDSSGSLLFALPAAQANLAELMRRTEQSQTDLNVILLSPSSPGSADGGAPVSAATTIHFVNTAIDSKALFSAALAQYPAYERHLRKGVATHFVAVTDDDDLLMPLEFKQQMEALLGHPFTFHAVASPAVDGMVCISEDQLSNPLCTSPIPAICSPSQIGTRYYELAALTGGEQVSICKHDWRPLIDRLEAAGAKAKSCP